MFTNNRLLRLLFTIFNIVVFISCASYSKRVERVCKKHGLKELPSPKVISVEYYYGKQKVTDLFELKQKIDSADIADSRQFKLDTIAIDIKGKVVYEGPKDRAVRPMIKMRLELPKDLLFEDIQKIRGYKGIRISVTCYDFRLFESNGHQIIYSSSFLEGGFDKSYSKIGLVETVGFIDGAFFFTKPYHEDDYYSFEINYTYLKGDNGLAYGEKGANLSDQVLGKGKFIFTERVKR